MPKPEALVQALGARESEAAAPASRKLVLGDFLADRSLSDQGAQPTRSDAPVAISRASDFESVLSNEPVIVVGLDRVGDLAALTTVVSTFGIGTESAPEKAVAPDGLRQGEASQPAASQPARTGQSIPALPVSDTGEVQAAPNPSIPSNDAGVIRPLTSAPSQAQVRIAPTNAPHLDTAFNTLSGGSGGNTTPPDKPPVIDYSGGTTVPEKDGNDDPIPGKYKVDGTVPVGAITFITVISPDTGYDITNISWSGGTDVSGYLSSDPSQPPPQSITVARDVKTNENNYVFVVDSHDRKYTVAVHVDYSNGAEGDATLEFNSVRPAIATIEADSSPVPQQLPLQPSAATYRVAATGEGMVVAADTQAHSEHGCDFMFIQIANIHRSYINKSNIEYFMSGENLIDDGATGLSLGMNLTTTGHSWHLDPGEPEPPPGEPRSKNWNQTNDLVIVPPPDATNDKQLTVGNFGDDSVPESFKTFLMYKPSSGVWVALAKIEWGWGLQLENQNGVWQEITGTAQNPPADPTVPIGPTDNDFWPVWVGKTSDLTWQ